MPVESHSASPSQLSDTSQVLAWQQTVGNRAVQRKLAQTTPVQLHVTSISQPTLQRDLKDDLPSADSYDAMQSLIKNAPKEEKRAVLAERQKLILERGGLSLEEQSALISGLLEGSQSWKNPDSFGKTYTGPFANFLAGDEDVMEAEGNMNCWESVLYAAYLTGLDRKRIKQWLDEIKESDWRKMNGGTAPKLWKALGLGEAEPVENSAEVAPEPGRLVFYALSDSNPLAEHVVLSIGGGYAMSLAGSGTSITRIKIADYSQDLKIKIGKRITEVIS
jgi:hypothetical protein